MNSAGQYILRAQVAFMGIGEAYLRKASERSASWTKSVEDAMKFESVEKAASFARRHSRLDLHPTPIPAPADSVGLTCIACGARNVTADEHAC